MSEKKEVHVVMLPWLAFGHMIPFLDLSIALAKFGIHISFISTPRNIQRLPKIPSNLSELIDFVPFSLPKLDSDLLPENAEATIDIPADKMEYLELACDLLQHPIKNFIARKQPDWIIVDFFHHWAVDIAQELNIHIIMYQLINATAAAFLSLAGEKQAEKQSPQHLTISPDEDEFKSRVAYKNHEATEMHNVLYGANATKIQGFQRIAKIMQASRAVAVRSCSEFEGDSLRLCSKNTGKAMIPVGFHSLEKTERESRADEPWSSIFNWLDRQNPKSVVFVAFGSEISMSKEQVHEIAYGLEISGVPFLWALRKPEGVVCNDVATVLPSGFSASTAAQGVVHLGWAPQREILGHPSIGGSFCHGGWNSITESMQYGHVLVFLPFSIDQPLNARLMEEKGLGVEVERGEDGMFTRNDVANALRKAMVSDEGQELRARAEQAASEIFANRKLQGNYVEKFAEYLKNEARVGK